MADAGNRGRGGFGRGRGRGGRPARGRRGEEKNEWVPVTKLGRLVKANKIKSIEEITFSLSPSRNIKLSTFSSPS
ncbi:unnamed protein product [Rhizopus stolonifer]